MGWDNDIRQAVEILKKGGVILYPTDTIWGLGCNATDEETVRKIARVKKRAESKSFIILVDSVEMLKHYFSEVPEDIANEMIHTDLPTTYILAGVSGLASSLIREDGTTGVRMPQDPFCVELIRELCVPLVSTSANFSGDLPPAHFGEIDPKIIKLVDYVVRWRQDDRTLCRPSRIVKILSDGTRKIIRE
ncbi:MAG TPA: threonylcarbamoyl-AMP synthase [Bacteroidetes bacterium]|nr:threonylcarbamoyl-AMP synthase [Bacteroidota bacterium]